MNFYDDRLVVFTPSELVKRRIQVNSGVFIKRFLTIQMMACTRFEALISILPSSKKYPKNNLLISCPILVGAVIAGVRSIEFLPKQSVVWLSTVGTCQCRAEFFRSPKTNSGWRLNHEKYELEVQIELRHHRQNSNHVQEVGDAWFRLEYTVLRNVSVGRLGGGVSALVKIKACSHGWRVD